jgi:hypothetical protein
MTQGTLLIDCPWCGESFHEEQGLWRIRTIDLPGKYKTTDWLAGMKRKMFQEFSAMLKGYWAPFYAHPQVVEGDGTQL